MCDDTAEASGSIHFSWHRVLLTGAGQCSCSCSRMLCHMTAGLHFNLTCARCRVDYCNRGTALQVVLETARPRYRCPPSELSCLRLNTRGSPKVARIEIFCRSKEKSGEGPGRKIGSSFRIGSDRASASDRLMPEVGVPQTSTPAALRSSIYSAQISLRRAARSAASAGASWRHATRHTNS